MEFAASRTDEARREALARAVERARADAEAMARAAGGRLGALLELTTEPRSTVLRRYAPQAVELAGEVELPTPILPGEQTITVRVMGRWRFEAH